VLCRLQVVLGLRPPGLDKIPDNLLTTSHKPSARIWQACWQSRQ
jgi:hypothetical protein